MTLIMSAIESARARKYDGCYERPEYFLVDVFSKGSTHNCMVIKHLDTKKELFAPDDPETTYGQLKKWLIENSIIIPCVCLLLFLDRKSFLFK